ncbi:hypothetical protein CR513_60211, partial [Mucuna pruriens]
MDVALSSISPQTSNPSSLLSSSNYRPAVILPGLGNNSGDYQRLKQTLKNKYGVPAVVAKVSRLDWLRNAAGLIDPNYWRGTLQPTPVLDWYLERVHNAVEEAKELTQSQVSLIGHSAGGWLARVYMEQFGLSHISLLLTLGTPHLYSNYFHFSFIAFARTNNAPKYQLTSPFRPPPKGVQGVIDQTRGLLHYVQNNCSKPVYTPQLKYVCIAGRYIRGARLFGNSNPDLEAAAVLPTDTTSQLVSEAAIVNTSPPPNTTLRARFVGQGYKQVCGQADVWGDGVVPQVSAHLEGALNICFDGVYHSPVGADDATRPWYGSPHVLDQWVEHLLN